MLFCVRQKQKPMEGLLVSLKIYVFLIIKVIVYNCSIPAAKQTATQ